jgi:hypothetical protein
MIGHKWKAAVWLVLFTAGAVLGACRRTYVIVPRPSGGYKPDTLRATLNGKDARVIFRFDTITHTQYIRVTDTLWRDGKLIIHDTLRLVRRDTIRVFRRDTLRLVIHDTVRMAGAMSLRADTVRIVRRDTLRILRVDTVRVATGSGRIDTVRVGVDTVRERIEIPRFITRVDTVRRRDTLFLQGPIQQQIIHRVDTVRVVLRDTVRVTRVDTVHVSSGGGGSSGRTLFVPPGHYPPEGQCRIWIGGTPPGQQRAAAPCDALGDIPAGAFILFGGVAWDFDHDWVSATAGSAPPQIVALQKSKGKKP